MISEGVKLQYVIVEDGSGVREDGREDVIGHPGSGSTLSMGSTAAILYLNWYFGAEDT